jgi:hypothetical protein
MKVSRREFIKGVAAAGAITCAGKWVGVDNVFSDGHKSQIFRVYGCPVHDGQLRHQGLDTLLDLLAENGLKFYRTNKVHQWGGSAGIIAVDDVVLIFNGEVVIFENGQGRGGFDGITQGGSAYDSWPEVDNEIWVNAEEQQVLTVDYLLYNVFKNDPVSSFLLDPVRSMIRCAPFLSRVRIMLPTATVKSQGSHILALPL